MPQAAFAAVAWVGSSVGAWLGGTAVAGGLASATASAVSAAAINAALGKAVFDIALYAGLQYAIDSVSRPKVTPSGSELQLNIDPAYPREMIIGERVVGGSMVARYSRGSNLYNAHFVTQLADHPCVELSAVYDGGRVVRDTPLTHGTRTEITAYSNSGGARVWMTWHDGRPGQTADSDLVTKSAQDPEVVAGKIPAWTNDHVGAGCAYVHIEIQWDSDILTSIPQFQFLVQGAKLYDRRKDSTAGGSGDHRLDDPSTWEYSTNAAVAADHYLLGYKVEDDDLAFGVGLSPHEVPYAIFANAADVADEDVETGTGGDVETIKRYVVNGVISAAEYFEEVLEAFQLQMASRFVDLGGRIGILGAEERDIVVDLDEGDLVSGEAMQFADKLPFSDLYGSVSGTFADPANLFQPTPYTTQETAYLALPDGGEAQSVTLPLPYEIHPRRADRLASAWLSRESLQPRLIANFMPKAWKLEPGDWFTFTSPRLQISMVKFEVIDIAKNDDFTVTLTARAIDPAFLFFDNDNDPDLSVPPDVAPVSLLLDEPEFDVEVSTLVAGGVVEPCLEFTLTSDETVAREIVVEYGKWDGSDIEGPTLVDSFHVSQIVTKLRKGVLPSTSYKVRAKAKAGRKESDWTAWSSAITTGATYAVGSAASVPWSGVTDSGGKPDDNADVTAANTAAAITGQGPWATFADAVANFLAPGANLLYNATGADGLNGWTHAAGWFVNDGPDLGRYIGRAVDGFDYIASALFPVTAGAAIRLSLNAGGVNVSGGYASVTWYDSDSDYLSDTAFATIASGVGFPRYSATVTPPTGAAYGAVVVGGTLTSGFLLFYKAKAERGTTETPWNDACTLLKFEDIEDGADVTAAHTAAAIASQGAFATLSTAAYGSGLLTGFGTIAALSQVYFGDGYIKETSGGTTAALSAFKTILGTASAITSQGAFATLNTVNSSSLIDAGVVIYSALASTAVRLGTNITRNDGTTSLTDALAVTSLGTAAAIASQGALATLSSLALGGAYLTGFGTVAALSSITGLTAGGITGQGALATLNTINSAGLLDTGVVTYTKLASTAVRLNTNIVREDGSTAVTDALVVTSVGVASAVASQGPWATLADGVDTIRRPGPNLIPNSTGMDGLNGWQNTAAWAAIDGADVGRAILTGTAGFQYITSARFPARASEAHTFAINAGGGTFTGGYWSVHWYTSGNAHIQEDSIGAIAAGAGYPRLSGTLTAPATAAFGRLQVAATIGSGGFFLFYKAKGEHGSLATQWEDFATPQRLSTVETGADVTSGHTAAAIASQGGLATLNFVHLNSNVRLQNGSTVATDAMLVTASGTAAAISGQGGLATLSFVTLNTNVRLQDGTTLATDAALVTASGTASAIAGQGGLATLSFVTISTNLRLADGTTVATTAMVVTASGTAAAIASQGALATANTVNTGTIDANSVCAFDRDSISSVSPVTITDVGGEELLLEITLTSSVAAVFRLDWAIHAALAGAGSLNLRATIDDGGGEIAFDEWLDVFFWDGSTGTSAASLASFTEAADSADTYTIRLYGSVSIGSNDCDVYGRIFGTVFKR